MNKSELYTYIDANADRFTAVSDAIWEYAELSLQEYRSADCYEKALKDAGFAVTRGLAGIDTAVIGTFGSGHPVIGILGEYDALTGLSQVAGETEHKPRPECETGHGCGHNLLGAGSFAAACAVKYYLEQTGKQGTVIFYGCPGEEGGAAKAFFAKENEFTKLDAAFSWHPDSANQVSSGSTMACIQKEYRFTGVAAHAAGNPEQGRSALDAAELMNIGVQFLREHMPVTASVHYAFTDGGGVSPNVVQPDARVLYMIREADNHSTLALEKRVDAIAAGAAMMSETKVETRFIDGLSNVVPNRVLETLLQRCFEQVPMPEYTQEELGFYEKLRETYADRVKGLPGYAAEIDAAIAAIVDEKSEHGTRPINDFLMPYLFSTTTMPGSTDVGDVSWQTPTAQIATATWPSMSPGHSWQNVACGKSSVAHKGMLLAAKVLAAACAELIDDPKQLEPARTEFEARTKAGFISLIPDGAKPEIV